MSNNHLIIFITGATVGLGRLAAKKCLQLGHTVIITGRSEEKLKDAKQWILKDLQPEHEKNLHGVVMDLLDTPSMKKAVETVGSLVPSIDVIVHNAGGTRREFSQIQKIESTVYMNAVAPLYLNQLLLPLIEKSQHPSKRIIFIASQIHNPEINGGGGGESRKIPKDVHIDDLAGDKKSWDSMKYYKMSKLAVIWGAFALAERYPSIKIVAICPGFVPTTELARNSSYVLRVAMKYAISKFNFATSEEDSTDFYISHITNPDLKTGTYYEKTKVATPSVDALNKTKQEEFYQLAEKTMQSM
ncbi:uncharacterized protein B0P05DRAFT_545971 [Gilbertella persicaria]|uniref:uncharacterized protein n=1 Tax=Gilbertella persicaria TaxID=101096 RepID=UPI0022202CF8|nr:uncharacterized protein B0P05DRAFT_545971 [Gilbertella persicaria]KAI8076469.1 hypothetical protein B0P05DRAFT_545971 [Gilbertella persicaria]